MRVSSACWITGISSSGRSSQCLVHDRLAQDGLAVIGDGNRAGGLERAIFGERFPHAAAGRRGDRKHARTGIALGTLHPARGLHRIVDRNGVGHGAYGGESTCGCRGCAGRDGFLVALPGLAQMDVDIDQARSDHEAGGFDHLRACLFGGCG